jgi:TonB family protein
MIEKKLFTRRHIASMIAAFSLMAAPFSLATGWTAGYEQGGMRSPARSGTMERETTMAAPPPSTMLIERSPSTADEYAAYVRDRLQAAAMQLKQQGTAELKLTISKDGSIQETEVVGVSGASFLPDEFARLVNRIKPLPPLPGNIDALVVTTDLAFDYPGENLYDHYGWLPRSPG